MNNYEVLKKKLESSSEYYIIGHMLGATVMSYCERFTDEEVDELGAILIKKIGILVENAEIGKTVKCHE